MKKLAIIISLIFLLSAPSYGHWPTKANQSKTDTSNFGSNLSSADDTVQKALDTLDEVAGVGDTTETNQDDAWKAVSDGTGTETFITVTYQDATNDVDFVVPVLDEDDMATDSAVHLATQQSIKAYVDASGTQLTEEEVEDYVGGMVTGNTETLITVTYQDADGTIDFVIDDAELTALSGLTSAANKLPYFTGSGTADVADLTAFARTILDDADEATFKATVNLEIGTDVQAFHAYLADVAGITAAQGDVIYFNGTDWVNLGPGTDGYYLKTQGVGANPVWAAPPGGGDVTAVGNCASGDCFVDGAAGNQTLTFEVTDNAFETVLSAVDPVADATVSIPNTTGTIFLTDGVNTDNAIIIMNGTGSLGESSLATIDATGTINIPTGQEYQINGTKLDAADLGDVALTDLTWSTGDVTINANSVALTTDTTGNYVATLADAGNSTITVTNGSTEGGAATVDAVDLNCTDCLNATEIEDIYILLAGDTITGNMTWSGTQAFNGEVTMGADLNLNAAEIQTTGNAVVQLSTTDNNSYFEIEDSSGTMAHRFYADGTVSAKPSADPYILMDDDTLTTEFVIYAKDTTTDVLQFGWTTDDSDPLTFFTMGAELTVTTGNFNIIGQYQVDGGQIDYADLAATGNTTPTGTWDMDSVTLQNIGHGTVVSGDNYTTISNNAAHDTIDELMAAINTWASGVSAGTFANLSDTADIDYTAGALVIGDGTNSFDEKPLSNHGTLTSAGALTVIDFATTQPAAVGEDLDINFDANDELVTLTSTATDYAAGSGIVTIYDDGTGQTNASYLLRLAREANGDAQDHFILFEDNSTGAAANGDDMFYVNSGGVVYAAGALTAASVTDGTVTLAGDGTITGVSVGGLPDNIVDNGTMADNAIDSAEIAAGAIDTAHIAADQITSALIADDQIDSEHYVAASIDNEHLADNAVGTAEIATDAVTMDSVDADGSFTSLTGAWATTGLLSGGVVTKSTAANYTIGTTNAAESYGGVVYVTSAATVTAPAVAAGMSFSVITIGAIAVSLDVNASDRMYLDGTALDDGDKATNTSTTGDILSCFYESAAGWYCISGSPDGDKWTDGGA